MTNNSVVNYKDDLSTGQHFDVAQSDEEDEDHQMISSSPSSIANHHSSSTITKIKTNDNKLLKQLYDDALELGDALSSFEPEHKEYVRKLGEVESLKTKYRIKLDTYKKRLDQTKKDIKHINKTYSKKGTFLTDEAE